MSKRALLKTVAIAISVVTISTFTACTSDNPLSPVQVHADVLTDTPDKYPNLDFESYSSFVAVLPMLGDGYV